MFTLTNVNCSTLKACSMILASLLLLSACASPKQAQIDFDQAANFSQYKTFAFYTKPSAPATSSEAPAEMDETPAENAASAQTYDPLSKQHFETAIKNEMLALGYQYDAQAPQLLVNYTTNVEEREDVRTSPLRINAGYGFFGRRSAFGFGFPLYDNVETHSYKVGTVLIDVIDAAENRLIWQGMLEGKLTRAALKNPEQAIAETVNLIYQRYPTRLTRPQS